jgi:hypothetical protein
VALGPTLRVRLFCGDDPADAIEFDVDGGWRWLDAERVYREGSDPPELEQIRRAWEVRGQVLTESLPATSAQVVGAAGRTLTFSAVARTITASSGSFLDDGIADGWYIGVDSPLNAGTYLVASVTAMVITLAVGTVLANEGPIATGTIDGVAENDGWSRHNALLAKLETRGDGAPTGMQLFEVSPNGVEVERLVLGPPTWASFRVEVAEGDVDDLNPSSAFQSSFGFYLKCSALLQREFDAGDGGIAGIVGFEQSIKERFTNGLREVTWTTTVTTKEGTDARVKAALVGAIPAGLYGGSYTYLTNGADSHGVGVGGVDVDVLDPDTRSDRVPTKAVAVSTVKEWAIDVGVTGPGSSPDEVSLVEAVNEDEEESTRIVSATARGPGALAWGTAQAPADFSSRKQSYDRATREFSATWEVKTESFVATYSIQAELSGGHQVFDYEPVTGGYAPVRFDGAVEAWQLTITITITKRGGTGALSEMKLPPLPGDPWSLDWRQSTEGLPTEAEPAKTAAKVKWGRAAKLVLLSNAQPKDDPAQVMRKNMASAVNSYYLPAGAGAK